MRPNVAVFGILRFPPNRMPEILPHLKILVETSINNDGCISYDVAVDLSEPGLIRFSELWQDHGSLEKHLNAPQIKPWRSVAKECGLIERKFTAYDILGSKSV